MMVIEKILSEYRSSTFDFREYAYPGDELAYLFEEWVPYYRMKYAICKVLRPSSILEIGVRYGYSAITFLKAAPNAAYVGIDNDTDTYGGSSGAINWARKLTNGYNAAFIIADSQKMASFPGNRYDLIHIDGQQDGDGTFHDLELALPKARWILVDGYFWSGENMLSATHFLKKYSRFIEYAAVIPGYAGDLLIKTNDSAESFGTQERSSLSLEGEYDYAYFQNDCGGYDSFKRTKGRILEDPRLIAAYLLAAPSEGKRILDLGCGRGELSFALAQSGADVTGIDYSSAAIDIAQKTYDNVEVSGELMFICADALTFSFEGEYDAIVATDFVEHVEPEAFDRILKNCAAHLKSGGRLILHTAPNRHYYDSYYPLLRQKGREVGCYLPANPRTYYEDLMHINEQTPEGLESLLNRYFKHVIVWVAPDDGMVGSLAGGYTSEEMNTSRSIFAVASSQPISAEELTSTLSQNPLDKSALCVEMELLHFPREMEVNRRYTLQVRLYNRGKEYLKSLLPYPVHISYHWLDENGKIVVFDGIRTPLTPPLPPMGVRDVPVGIITPLDEGAYTLQITLVQEFQFWFEDSLPNVPLSVDCTIQNNISQEKSN